MSDDQMDPRLLSIYQSQVAEQTAYILEAFAGVQSPFYDRMWFSIQALLSAAANVSKLLWGSRSRRAAQRAELRASLGVSDTSPLRETVVRDHFEHFDERLEEWWGESPRHAFADRNTVQIDGLEEKENFRALDPTTGNVTFWGTTINIRDIVIEAERLYPIADRAARQLPLQSRPG